MMILPANMLWSTLVIIYLVGHVWTLQCWHCIGDDCDLDPTDNYKASKRVCNPGQHCQKVFYEMFYEEEGFPSKLCQSTLRGCSTECSPKDDFTNCTHDLRTTRGCVRKDCCADADLCNASPVMTSRSLRYVGLCVVCLLVFVL